MEVVNPATGERVATYEAASPTEVEQALTAAEEAIQSWRDRPIREREDLLENLVTQVDTSIEAGATVEIGGKRSIGRGTSTRRRS